MVLSTSFSSPSGASQTPYVSFTYDPEGNRKYLTLSERRRFIAAAQSLTSQSEQLFCLTLVLTGARLSEVLALTPRQIDEEAGVIILRSLKKRRKAGSPPVYRAVPVPPFLLHELADLPVVSDYRKCKPDLPERIWPWCRTTAWKRVKEVMETAEISGVKASPKGLRHGFAVGALVAGVPEITVMRWLGHARLETTMIYAEAVGAEAQALAMRMWKPLLQ